MQQAVFKQGDIAFQSNLYASQNPTRNWLHNARRSWVMHQLDVRSHPYSNFLEVGIGCGIYTEWMAQRGYVTGLDINEDFVVAASYLSKVTARVADITTTNDYEDEFDVALCSEVIEHISDSQAALNNIYRALKPGGQLILTTPNGYSTMELFARLLSFKPFAGLARLIYREPVQDLGHINRLTRNQLAEQIQKAGFEVVIRKDLALYLPVVTEFGGKAGARFCKWMAQQFSRSEFLSHLLWTQCWVLRKPAHAAE